MLTTLQDPYCDADLGFIDLIAGVVGGLFGGGAPKEEKQKKSDPDMVAKSQLEIQRSDLLRAQFEREAEFTRRSMGPVYAGLGVFAFVLSMVVLSKK